MNEYEREGPLHLLTVTDSETARQRVEACCAALPAWAELGQRWYSEAVDDLDSALSRLEDGAADALLLDLAPRTLHAALGRIRERGLLTPILAVTDGDDPATAASVLAAGADEWLPAEELTPLLLERSLRLCSGEQKAASDLAALAQHDILTGLPNARLFERQLDPALHTAQRHGHHMALVCLQLDDFQQRVREAGQEASERLLQQTAARLRSLLRRSDLVARSQGEEFLLLLECSTDLTDLALTASRILEAVAAGDGDSPGSPASMGIAVFPRSSQQPRQLLQQARTALEQVREAGGHDFQVYDEALEVVSQRRVLMQQALPGAIARGEFSVRFQPRIELATGRIVAAEVLLRWQSPEFGAVSPAQFIPVAEASGVIHRIGAWVMEAAIRAGRTWFDAGHPLRLAVNVSAGQFEGGDFCQHLDDLLRHHGLPAEWLELELTEGVFVANVAQHQDIFTRLNELGIGIAVDDFGTGYSALAYLRHFPVHALKIDRTFISPLPGSADDAAIVRAIVAMGQTLDLRVVAEGVDDDEQVAFLRDIGCDEIQGFLVGKPMTANELAARLQDEPGVAPLP